MRLYLFITATFVKFRLTSFVCSHILAFSLAVLGREPPNRFLSLSLSVPFDRNGQTERNCHFLFVGMLTTTARATAAHSNDETSPVHSEHTGDRDSQVEHMSSVPGQPNNSFEEISSGVCCNGTKSINGIRFRTTILLHQVFIEKQL